MRTPEYFGTLAVKREPTGFERGLLDYAGSNPAVGLAAVEAAGSMGKPRNVGSNEAAGGCRQLRLVDLWFAEENIHLSN